MNRYQVEFTLNSGEKIETIMGHNQQSELSQNIKYRLSTLKYWELQLEEGKTVLVTDEVASFRVSPPLEKDGSSVESKNYTFAALIFRELDE